MPAPDDVQAFLDAHPEISSVDLLISDLNGVMRGKRIPRESLGKAYAGGIALPASVFALDILGNTIEETGLGLDSGDGDRLCRPVPGSLKPVPWVDRKSTRLNSSHVRISYAVFCLKKKNKQQSTPSTSTSKL